MNNSICRSEILKITNLTKYYGNILGVKDLSLTLNEGEVFGFIGPNGAGKSTTIRSVMNLINKTNGTILINGKEFNKDDIKTKELIGYLPSEIHLYEDLTVKKMLDYHESFYNKDIHKRRCYLVEKLKLDETKNIEDLSLGNSKKLGIVLAFMHEPKLLILDEPTSGLDPIMQQVFYELLEEEKKKGTTIFYSTHILSEISKICDRVGIIKEGHLLKIESMKEMHKKNLTFVTIESNEAEKIASTLKVEIISKKENIVKFKNTLSSNLLLKELIKYKIDKILIEEPSLEDIFLHYYK
ncbi:MAG: ABC transporter ATP-binding protein [Clostridia bacterium]|nr:ABC transporter ATP-binding protein [Clostridia bacterium]